ncbi:MAG TPA: permease [Candidatus Omnitrophica bacterium]|nr:MAG: permease [Omnitrophica WOR_2 bacterium GWA2_47_8]HBR14074.1 permease [Candidatus Omnitrophota bacterium]
MPHLLYILVGLIGGIFSGAFGIGGGAIMVPALVYLAALTQHQAQGTILAVLMVPVGALAVLRYYQSGNVKIDIALWIALGFIFGALIGANFVHGLPEAVLKRAFGVFLILMGIKMALLK